MYLVITGSYKDGLRHPANCTLCSIRSMTNETYSLKCRQSCLQNETNHRHITVKIDIRLSELLSRDFWGHSRVIKQESVLFRYRFASSPLATQSLPTTQS